jgi:hypothetical protein
MAKKDLPALDFHALVARRDPALADRLAREGLTQAAAVEASPILAIVPPGTTENTPSVTAIDDNDDVDRSVTPPSVNEPPPRALPKMRGATAVSAPAPTTTKARRRGVVQRADGREAGRLTVYVPASLALRLKQHCFEHDRTVSEVAAEVLVDALERRLRKQP